MGSLDSILANVKQDAQSAPPSQPPAAPAQIAPETPELQNVLQKAKEDTQPSAQQSPQPKLTEDALLTSMQQKRQFSGQAQDVSEVGGIAKMLIPSVLETDKDKIQDAANFFQHTSAGRVLDAMGHSVEQSTAQYFSQTPYVTSKDLEDLPINGENKWQNAINEHVVRPAIINGTFLANKAMEAVSIPFNALIAGAKQTTEEVSGQTAGENVEKGLSDPALMMLFHQIAAPHVSLDEDSIHSLVTKPPLPDEVNRGVNNGILTPSDPTIKSEAAQYVSAKNVAPAAEATPPTIAELTRGADTDTHVVTTAASARQDLLRRGIDNLKDEQRQQAEASAPHSDEDIQAEKDKIADATPRMAKKYQARIEKMQEENQTHIDEQTSQETPQIQALRQGITDLDLQKRDLAEKSTAARKEAENTKFTQEDHPISDAEWQKLRDADKIKTDASGKEYVLAKDYWDEKAQKPVSPEVAQEPVAPSGKPIEEQHQAIAQDISAKAQAAGLSKEQADTGAMLQAKGIYGYFAKMFGMSSEEFYAKHGAEFRGTEKPEEGLASSKGSYANNIINIMKGGDITTMMHEGAHHFLALMDRFSKETDAPASLLSDMNTIRNWLKLKDIDDLADIRSTRRAHEQFARGFEQYLKEGKAPSPELASVFAKMKEWFSGVYSAVKNIKYQGGQFKLTNEARSFFDRTLSENPQERISSAEPEAVSASTHESEAKNTPIDKAAEVADKIKSDIEQTAQTQDEDVANVIKSAETASSAEATSTPSGTTATGQPSGQANAVEEPTPVAAGGSNVEGKSTAGREGTVGPRGNRNAVSAKPIIAKDGTIDTSSAAELGNDEFLRRYNAELVKLESNNALSKMFSFEETVKLNDLKSIAEQMNMTVDQMMAINTDYGSLTERPILRAGAYILMKQLHEEMIAKAKDAIASGNAESVADFLRSYDKRDQLLNAYKTTESLSKEAGVHLVASKIIEAIDVTQAKDLGSVLYQLDKLQKEGQETVDLKQEDIANMEKLINSIAGMDKTEDVAGLLGKTGKQGFWDKFMEWRMAALVSGFVTHSSYAIGNLALNLYKSTIEDTYSAVVDKVAGVLGGEITGDELTGGLKGLAAQLKYLPNTLSATGTAIRTGKTVLLPHENPWVGKSLFENIKKISNVDPEVAKQVAESTFNEDSFPAIKNIKEEIARTTDQALADKLKQKLSIEVAKARDAFVKTVTSELQSKLKTYGDAYTATKDFMVSQGSAFKHFLQDQNSGSLENPFVKSVEIAAKTIYSSIHTFQRYSIMYGELAQEARRAALAEGAEGQTLEIRTNQIMSNPSKEVMDKVSKVANDLSFMNQDSEYAKKLNAFLDAAKIGDAPIGKIIAPITTVPTNIAIETVLKRTPLGILDTKIRADLTGSNGADARNKAWSRVLGGTSMIALGYVLAQHGLATPSASSNYKGEPEVDEAGKQANSIRVGDWMVDISAIPVLSNLITLGADLHHIRDVALGADESETLKMSAYSAVRNFAFHENALVNIADAMDAITGGKNFANYLENQTASLVVPALVKQTSDLSDPDQRNAKTMMDKIKARIPGLSETVEPKINALTGEVIPQKSGAIPATKFYTSPATPDPIAEQLFNLRVYPANPKPLINGVELTPQQSSEYSSVKGHILNSGLQMLMQGDGAGDYTPADSDTKRKMIHKVETHAANCAKSVMFGKYPELLKDANDRYEAECRNETP